MTKEVKTNNTFTPLKIKPKTKNQKKYLFSLQQNVPLVIAEGMAGSGKTLMAINWASHEIESGNKYKKLVLIRPPEPLAGRTVGFLKGTAQDKMGVWVSQLIRYIKDAVGSKKYEELLFDEKIDIQLLESIRGMSFNDSIIVVDESQLLTPKEIQALTTRIGTNSKIIFCGDTLQTDIKKSSVCGLTYLKDIVNSYDINCDIISFTVDDCMRSDLCKQFLLAYSDRGWDNF